MAHIHVQTAAHAESQGVPSAESSLDLEDSDNSKDGTCSGGGSVSDTLCSMSPNSFLTDKSELTLEAEDKCETSAAVATAALEDTSCAVKKKKKLKSRKVNKVLRDSRRSECRTIKGGAGQDSAVSCVPTELEEGCATLNLATTMERVNPDMYAYGRTGSPSYPSSENEWEASDHSDTNTDHTDSSDDDNPTSQVDRMIERGVRLIVDGENSNLSSETDDTSDDEDDVHYQSDSDITDVSPLISNSSSPLGLSPVMSRRNILPSSTSCATSRPAFVRHYSHRGHDGDVEDEADEDNYSNYHHLNPQWNDDYGYGAHNNADNNTSSSNSMNAADMSLVVQALIEFGIDQSKNNRDNTSLDSENQNHEFTTAMPAPHGIRNRHHNHHHMSPALQANPHHRHLRKNSHPKRKNMSFSNEEVRLINRENKIILEKIIAVSNRPEQAIHGNCKSEQVVHKPATATINRKQQEDSIQKENLAFLRRLNEVKPSRAVTASRSSRHHSKHSSKHHYQPCSLIARHSHFSPPHQSHHHHHHHHSPKETAL